MVISSLTKCRQDNTLQKVVSKKIEAYLDITYESKTCYKDDIRLGYYHRHFRLTITTKLLQV